MSGSYHVLDSITALTSINSVVGESPLIAASASSPRSMRECGATSIGSHCTFRSAEVEPGFLTEDPVVTEAVAPRLREESQAVRCTAYPNPVQHLARRRVDDADEHVVPVGDP